MDEKHFDFNAEKLTRRKHNFSGYAFCPFCKSELKRKTVDNHERLVCSGDNCDFIYYHNPIPAAGVILS